MEARDENGRLPERCFACGRPLAGKKRYLADTREDQYVYVGPECHRKIIAAGETGHLPALGGPVLYRLTTAREQYFRDRDLL